MGSLESKGSNHLSVVFVTNMFFFLFFYFLFFVFFPVVCLLILLEFLDDLGIFCSYGVWVRKI